jgi:D-alanine-D-alanine ligase
VINALDRSKYDVKAAAITRSGKWLDSVLPEDYRKKFLDDEHYSEGNTDSELFPDFLKADREMPEPEVIVPILHGPFGEDGTMQGLLEMMDLPYVGSGVLGSALAMDKAAAKYMCLAYGIPVVDFLDFLTSQWDRDEGSVVEAVEENIAYPCFVKPANLGSSIGISKVRDEEELVNAINQAFGYDRKIIVERALDCREIECSVLGNDEPEASVAGEIVPCNEFYDYQAKYVDDRSELIIPARIPVEDMEQIQEIAVEAFKALNCFGMARADFFIDKDSGDIFFSEINTIPGFTPISMYPQLWEASGLPYPGLLDRLIELALERYEQKQNIHGNILQPRSSESV